LFAVVVVVVVAVGAPTMVGCKARDREANAKAREVSGPVFGTTYHVVLVGPGPGGADLERLVEASLERVDATMSTYRADSDLSRFNAAAPGKAIPMDPAVFEVLSISGDVVARSEGAFDPTVGPLVRAWGFGPDERPQAPPDIEGLRARVGWSKIAIDAASHTATKSTAGQELDLSAVAKGFAVDRVAQVLAEAGATNYMVEVGGEVRVAGLSPQGRPWRIGIEQPDAEARSVHAAVELDDRAMATSGDYRNYYEVDGQRVSHTIDPRTGRPIAHRLASVTVLADTCAAADAWATALNVLGPAEGLAKAESEGLDAYLIVRAAEGFEVRHTSGFPLVQR